MLRKLSLTIALAAALALPASASAWPTWGSIENNDCAFAAAADWELLHGGTQATDASILAEYQALEPEDEGIDGDQLESYWRHHGIGGVRAHVRTTDRYGKRALRTLLRRGQTPIVELAVEAGQQWRRLAGIQAAGDTATHVVDGPGGVHFAVVRYINSRGPVLLTWGQLAQMTWWQWREDAMLLYLPHLL